MKALDTNVLVRLIARDDEEQIRLAEEAIATADILLLPTVVLEAEWVLRARFRMTRQQIGNGFEAIAGQENVLTVSAGAVSRAVAEYKRAGDFGDLLHLALAEEAGATELMTFDRKFARPEGAGVTVQKL